MIKEAKQSQSDLREFFKSYPKFYYFIANVFGPMWFSGLGPKVFLKKYWNKETGICLNLGSGPNVLPGGVVNVDITPYPGVAVVADIANLPHENNSVQAIVCNTVIEHVESPEKIIAEMARVLKPGGAAYITLPFLYPFHSSPSDFTRWTEPGFALLVADFKIVESGVRAGPFSALTVYLCYLFAVIFSFNTYFLFWILVNVSMFVFFPIKFLDIIFARFKSAKNLAAILYFVIQKND